MSKSKEDTRRRFRPVEQTSVLDKRFKKVVERPKHIRPKIHPLMVIADLRKGSLASLDQYLAQEGELRDRQVAIELRKLISGSRCRSRFRLLVIHHPDGAPNVGGTPKGKRGDRAERYAEIAALYHEVFARERKAWLAKEVVADVKGCSKRTVERALQEEREAAEREQAFEYSKKLRGRALANLRNPSRSGSR